MAEITVESITKLREKTGCGMMDCKKALTEAKGDMDAASDLLREKGLAAVAARSNRVAAQGLIDSYIHFGGKIGVLVEVNSESDFVARNIEFQAFVKDVTLQIAASNPQYVSRNDVPDGIIKHEQDILTAQAKGEGKNEKALEKIVSGRLEKFFEEMCLLDQPYIKDPKKKVRDLLAELVAKIGENIVIRRFIRYQLGEKS